MNINNNSFKDEKIININDDSFKDEKMGVEFVLVLNTMDKPNTTNKQKIFNLVNDAFYDSWKLDRKDGYFCMWEYGQPRHIDFSLKSGFEFKLLREHEYIGNDKLRLVNAWFEMVNLYVNGVIDEIKEYSI